MIDRLDRHTQTLPGIKEPVKRGRKTIFSKSMTAAERKARSRKLQIERVSLSEPYEWSEQDCLMVLANKKLQNLQKMAWERLGQLREYA
ncbi:hypothetical protein [Neptuniibacter sp.]|uniref:hypothetical protein n=1 Tax=Neptuniibacter sp. TaxID=1962643 RepID=UPI00260F007F|nr:hypothetical protein [Neptuniibacter sp.]MCP4595367.1 hypothetical protein [Neptuniibacter sp.]